MLHGYVISGVISVSNTIPVWIQLCKPVFVCGSAFHFCFKQVKREGRELTCDLLKEHAFLCSISIILNHQLLFHLSGLCYGQLIHGCPLVYCEVFIRIKYAEEVDKLVLGLYYFWFGFTEPSPKSKLSGDQLGQKMPLNCFISQSDIPISW